MAYTTIPPKEGNQDVHLNNDGALPKLGKRNLMRIDRIMTHGAYLDGGRIGDILLPTKLLPRDAKAGDIIDVFLYLDHEERLVATTEKPLVEVGGFAYLECTWVNQYGAYLNWGLTKDLFCPFREQAVPMQPGKRYQVYCYIDNKTYRIVCTSRIQRLLKNQKENAGIKEPRHTVRHDNYTGRSNLTSRPLLIDDFAPRLLQWIKEHGGECPYHDHSPSDAIYKEFGVSKRTFKQAVGNLYKNGHIQVLPDRLLLAKR